MIWFILLAIVHSILDAIEDGFKHINKNKKLWHFIKAVRIGMVLIYGWLYPLAINPILILLFLAIRWIVFDATFNTTIGVSLWHKGTVAQTDTFIKDKRLFYIAKVLLLTLSIILL